MSLRWSAASRSFRARLASASRGLAAANAASASSRAFDSRSKLRGSSRTVRSSASSSFSRFRPSFADGLAPALLVEGVDLALDLRQRLREPGRDPRSRHAAAGRGRPAPGRSPRRLAGGWGRSARSGCDRPPGPARNSQPAIRCSETRWPLASVSDPAAAADRRRRCAPSGVSSTAPTSMSFRSKRKA